MSDILLTEQTSASATPSAGRVVIYPKNDGYLYFKNDTGVETRVNPQTVATAAEWTALNPTLAAGVFGVESDTMKFKIGDGATTWNSLAYWRYTAEHISIATTGGDTVLTTPQSRASSMAVTGALTSNVNIITPDVMALFVAENLTTGAFTVTFKTAAGTGVAIEQGEHAILYADGTDIEKPDPSGVGSNLTLARIAGSTYSTIQHWRNNLASAGIVSGGVMSDAGGATINVTAGSCAIRPTTSHTSTLYFSDFPANNGIAIPTDTIRYVGVEYNAGSPVVAIRATDDFDYMTNFPIGVVTNEAGVLHLHTSDRHDMADSASHIAERMEHTAIFARDEVIGGLILGETGTRNITMSAGAMWQKLVKLTVAAFNSSTGGTFDIYYRDGASGFTKVAAATQWPNTQYDNGTGTLATLANNKFGVLWFYLEADDSDIIMVYGRVEHGSVAAAEAEVPPATVPNRITAGARILGKLVFEKSAAVASSVSSVFTQAFSTTGSSDHSNLANLDYASAGHTGFQPSDATLTSLALLGTAADKLAYTTGVNTWAETPLTAAARTVLDDATVSAMVDTLGGATSTGTGGLVRATAAAINPTSIGATTPGTGAFTTLSASGKAIVDSIGIGINPPAGVVTTKLIDIVGGAGSNSQIILEGDAGAQFISILSGTSGANLPSIFANNGIRFAIATNKAAAGYAEVGRYSPTGLAVTGAISSTTTGKVGTTIGVGNATPAASGAGITFPATQSASTDANTLDDYEEGTWTPTLTPGTSGTITLLGNVIVSYVKIGKKVFGSGQLVISSVSSPVGTTLTLSLPFTSATNSYTENDIGCVVLFRDSSASYAITQVPVMITGSGATVATLVQDASIYAANDRLLINFHYSTP